MVDTKFKEEHWTKRKSFSEESKKKMSESQKKRFSNPDEIKKLSEAHQGQIPWSKGKKHTSESLLKMSTSHKKQMANPEVRIKMREATKKVWLRPGIRERQSEARKGDSIHPQKQNSKKG